MFGDILIVVFMDILDNGCSLSLNISCAGIWNFFFFLRVHELNIVDARGCSICCTVCVLWWNPSLNLFLKYTDDFLSKSPADLLLLLLSSSSSSFFIDGEGVFIGDDATVMLCIDFIKD